MRRVVLCCIRKRRAEEAFSARFGHGLQQIRITGIHDLLCPPADIPAEMADVIIRHVMRRLVRERSALQSRLDAEAAERRHKYG